MTNPNTHMTVADLMAWLATQDQNLPVRIACNLEYDFALYSDECRVSPDRNGQDSVYLGE
jgi:hypothetical protein